MTVLLFIDKLISLKVQIYVNVNSSPTIAGMRWNEIITSKKAYLRWLSHVTREQFNANDFTYDVIV